MVDLDALTRSVGELDEVKVKDILTSFAASAPTEEEAQKTVAACQKGMGIVGDLFEKGEYFVGDLIFAGALLMDAIEILKPVIGTKGTGTAGTIVLGTVHGDMHDIGKNIFKSMAEAAGFLVHDIGIDQGADSFVNKVRETRPAIVGMSGVLTLSIESMKETIQALADAGLRDGTKIIIGGNPVTEEVRRYVGADAFTTNAAEGIKICQKWGAGKP
jgi:methanogenic corrinoid protein MtbC1